MKVAIALGSSLGDRRANLELALRKLAAHPGLTLIRASRWVRTPPMRGGTAHGWFLNGVALFASSLSLEALLAVCVSLEAAAGRRRTRFWGDRVLDLDILHAEGIVREDPRLTLPHPGISTRPFVFGPLHEVWPDATDPRTGRTFTPVEPAPVPRAVLCGVPARSIGRTPDATTG